MNTLNDLENSMVWSEDITISTMVENIYDASTSEHLYTKVSAIHTPMYLWIVFWLISMFVISRLFLEFIIYLRKK